MGVVSNRGIVAVHSTSQLKLHGTVSDWLFWRRSWSPAVALQEHFSGLELTVALRAIIDLLGETCPSTQDPKVALDRNGAVSVGPSGKDAIRRVVRRHY